MQNKVSSDFDHMVLLYKNSELLIRKIAEYVTNGFAKGEPAALVLRTNHIKLFERQLRLQGYDSTVLQSTGRLRLYDARTTMKKLIKNGMPNKEAFSELVDSLFKEFQPYDGNIRIYGEMVAILWSEGNKRAALALENLWNDYAKKRRFDLFCAYSHSDLTDTDVATVLLEIDHCHSRVVTPQTQLG